MAWIEIRDYIDKKYVTGYVDVNEVRLVEPVPDHKIYNTKLHMQSSADRYYVCDDPVELMQRILMAQEEDKQVEHAKKKELVELFADALAENFSPKRPSNRARTLEKKHSL